VLRQRSDAERYTIYYGHKPGAVFSPLIRPAALLLTRSGWRGANSAIGRRDNKLSVQTVHR
jgi:hypothetical protein